MALNAEQKCLLWLSNAEISAGHVQKLLEVYGSAEEIWLNFDKPQGPRFPAAARSILKATHTAGAIDDLAEKLEHKNINLLFLGRRALSCAFIQHSGSSVSAVLRGQIVLPGIACHCAGRHQNAQPIWD